MRNPLRKRLPKELKSDLGKYMVLFLFIVGMIGIVSGFSVAGNSMTKAYHDGFEKYNIEDGNFEILTKAEEELIESLEKEEVSIYENFYIDEEVKENGNTLRVFINREEVNKVNLMQGDFPQKASEIALDRMHAVNNDLKIGDIITVGNVEFTISGLVSLSDYTALFENPSDMMFDAIKFGVSVVTKEGFAALDESHIHYSYSWIYEHKPADDSEAKEKAEDFLEILAGNTVIKNYIPQYTNQAIHFTGDDIGRDSAMLTAFLYIIFVILAFIFAITISNTISNEAAVIGTLRATGYTKMELVRHYLALPMLITSFAAVVGNVLGYTVFKDFAANMYYNSYSLPTFVTLWNMDAFVKTTILPLVIMACINVIILVHKLNLSPLQFLRRDLKKNKKKKAFRLNSKMGIMKRFRIRIFFQNMPNYITIIIGIILANLLIFFGLVLMPIMVNYQKDIETNLLADYQYILKMPMNTETEGTEPFSMASLKTIEGRRKSEDVTLYGIEPDSTFIQINNTEKGVFISDAYASKFRVKTGEVIILRDAYTNKEYEFFVEGIYDYPAAIAVFMDREYLNETFEKDEGHFDGYFSKEEISDMEDVYIATEITKEDLTKTSRQLIHSFGGMIYLFAGFGVLMFMLIIYLLSKIIIEKNAQPISMTKILGYSKKEIVGLYILTTSIVVVATLIFSLPVVDVVMNYICEEIFSTYPGWLPYYREPVIFVQIVLLGVISYGIIASLQMKKINKIPLDIALKNVE